MGRAGSYVKNAVILTAVGLALRAAGMLLRVSIAGQIGAEGMGLYQLVFTVYSLCSTAASAGLSVAATRLASEELTKPGAGAFSGVLGRVVKLSLELGCLAGGVQFCLAGPIARFWLGDVRTALGLKLLAPALPFVSVSAAIRGCFFARRQVMPGVKAQLFEQLVRVGLILTLVPRAALAGMTAACAAVMLSNTISELCSGLLMLWYYRQSMRKLPVTAPPEDTDARIWKIAAPVEGGRCLDSALHTVENILVPACLLTFLQDRRLSLAQFGALKGMAMPLLLFPFSFLTPLSTLLMPEITEAHILGQKKQLERLVGQIMLFTNVFSVLAGGLICLNARPLARLLYQDESVALYLAVLGPVLPAMYLDTMGDAILKGLGEEMATFRYSLWDSVLRIGLVLALVPRVGMKGFLLVMLLSNVLSALLNLVRIRRTAGIRIRSFQWFLKPGLIFAAAAALGQDAVRLSGLGGWPLVLTESLAIGGLYLLLMLVFGLGKQLKALFRAEKCPAGGKPGRA